MPLVIRVLQNFHLLRLCFHLLWSTLTVLTQREWSLGCCFMKPIHNHKKIGLILMYVTVSLPISDILKQWLV